MSAGIGFDVVLAALDAGVEPLASSATEIRAAGTLGAAEAASASGACGGGPLAGALSGYADTLSLRSGQLEDGVSVASSNLGGNAARYRGDDDAARVSLNSTFGG